MKHTKNPSFRKRLFAWTLQQGANANHSIYGDYKINFFKALSGIVVEVGPRTGINFQYLPSTIEWIGIEPNKAFHRILMANAKVYGIDAKLVPGDASYIPLHNNSVDTIICTLVLCSVDDPQQTIAEMKRVLKPGGRLIFIEHVASPHQTVLRFIQNIINPINKCVADGCHCNRETWLHFERAGFSEIAYIHHRMDNVFCLHAPHVMGYVVK